MNEKYNVKSGIVRGLFTENPPLIEAIGLSPAFFAADDLKTAVAISAMTFITVLISGIMISLIRDHIHSGTRLIIFCVVAAGLAMTESALIRSFAPSLFDKLGVVLPIAAFNTFVICFVRDTAMKNNVTATFFEGAFKCFGFALAICLTASLREAVCRGTLLGMKLFGENYKCPYFFTHPAGILIMTGAVAALFGALRKENGGKRNG